MMAGGKEEWQKRGDETETINHRMVRRENDRSAEEIMQRSIHQ